MAIELIAANSRTISDMIRRFYGSNVKSVHYMGTGFVWSSDTTQFHLDAM